MTSLEDNAVSSAPASESRERPEGSVKASSSGKERWLVYIIAAAVLLLDYISKEIVRNNLPLYTYWAPFPALENWFRFAHTSNTGVAFGLFQNANLIFAVFALIVSSGIIYFNQKIAPGQPLLRVALGLQLGGALGNLLDRVTQGSVTDFLDFGPWPVFNVADMAVVAGVILMGYIFLLEERRERQRKEIAPDGAEPAPPAHLKGVRRVDPRGQDEG
jgi:signal peptidase II